MPIEYAIIAFALAAIVAVIMWLLDRARTMPVTLDVTPEDVRGMFGWDPVGGRPTPGCQCDHCKYLRGELTSAQVDAVEPQPDFPDLTPEQADKFFDALVDGPKIEKPVDDEKTS